MTITKFILNPEKDLLRQIANRSPYTHPNMLRYRCKLIRETSIQFDQDGYGYSMTPYIEQAHISIIPRTFSKPEDMVYDDLLTFLRFWEIIK